jgi:adenylosuccinate lyase
MLENNLKAISPLDGRYYDKTSELTDIFSEFGLIKYRVLIEIKWIQHLAMIDDIKELPPLDKNINDKLNNIIENFDITDALKIKSIEKITNHDVKAVEYFIRDSFEGNKNISDFIHFGCTSEDINNIAYALMLDEGRSKVILPLMGKIQEELKAMAHNYKNIPMLARTHGQTASPTTVGKEIANIVNRFKSNITDFQSISILGKFNGAVGNFNAHISAYPECDWVKISSDFIKSLGLKPNHHTTQIEPHDWISKYCHNLIRYNLIMLDISRDIWSYISLGYFKQRLKDNEVGSSTMPHKVNPIDFENAEGNLGLANSILSHLSEKLPISRLQRDLSDSTVQRNFGVSLGYIIIAMKAFLKGISKLELDQNKIKHDLTESWEVLSEAIQTVMRRHGISEPYEKLKKVTRGQKVNEDLLHELINSLDIPQEAKDELLSLTPSTYTGIAESLAEKI